MSDTDTDSTEAELPTELSVHKALSAVNTELSYSERANAVVARVEEDQIGRLMGALRRNDLSYKGRRFGDQLVVQIEAESSSLGEKLFG